MHIVWADGPTTPEVDPIPNNTPDFRGIGKQLLCWMLRDPDLQEFFTVAPSQTDGTMRLLEKMPIHLAVELKNWSFLACFLGICHDSDLKDLRPKLNGILEARDDSSLDRNCVHQALDFEIPFAPFLAAVCSAQALKDRDR